MTWAIDDFFCAIVEDVYIAPGKLVDFKARLKKARVLPKNWDATASVRLLRFICSACYRRRLVNPEGPARYAGTNFAELWAAKEAWSVR